jgi:hypothetical protein
MFIKKLTCLLLIASSTPASELAHVRDGGASAAKKLGAPGEGRPRLAAVLSQLYIFLHNRTSTVTLCSVDGEALAVKAYAKARMRPRHLLNLRRELAVLTHLRQAG